MISSSQRPLRDNTQHSQDTDIHAPGELTILAGKQPQTYALDRAATGTGEFLLELENFETNVVEKIKTLIFCALTFSRT